jgi:hypothetical protein
MSDKIEYRINQEVASFMEENYEWVVNTSVSEIEDYAPYDIVYTAQTENVCYVSGQEVKSIMGFPLKEDGEFRDYFKEDIKNKLKFGEVPEYTTNITELPKYWDGKPKDDEIPENIETKPIYILNAADKYNNIHNSKWYKMNKNKIGLTLCAEDGIIMFSHSQLKKAFMGYAWYLNKSHTELYNKKIDPHYELKALIDLSKGSYYPNVVNKELFKKSKYEKPKYKKGENNN